MEKCSKHTIDSFAHQSGVNHLTDSLHNKIVTIINQSQDVPMSVDEIQEALQPHKVVLGPHMPVDNTPEIQQVEQGRFVREQRFVQHKRDGSILGHFTLRSDKPCETSALRSGVEVMIDELFASMPEK